MTGYKLYFLARAITLTNLSFCLYFITRVKNEHALTMKIRFCENKIEQNI